MSIKELVNKYGYRKCLDKNNKRWIVVDDYVEKEIALKIANSVLRESYKELKIVPVFVTDDDIVFTKHKKLISLFKKGKRCWGICRNFTQ